MPQQLIYTSSERGLVVGRSGYCTVACSEGMREALQSRLEQLSQYEHATIAGRHPAICAYRVIAIRGARFHVLSRMVDAGLDFTSRTNFTAHHLVFDPAEVASMASPPLVFLHWDGWRDKWAGEPQWLRSEHWGNLYSLPAPSLAPCLNWQALTGDAANAAALLDARPETFLADGLDHTRSLALLAETLAVQVARPGGGQAWQTPFTTFLQEGDDAADFRWRLVYSATPAHARLLVAGLAPRPLRELRAGQVDELTAAYARSGPQPLQITAQPEDLTLSEGQPLVLRVGVRALPAPQRYQWSQKRVQSAWTELPGQNGNTLQIPHYSDPGQISRFKVVIWDAGGKPTESSEAKVQVQRGQRLAVTPAPHATPAYSDETDTAAYVRPQRSVSPGWGVDESIRSGAPVQKTRWGIWLALASAVLLFGCLGALFIRMFNQADSDQGPSGARSSAPKSVGATADSSAPAKEPTQRLQLSPSEGGTNLTSPLEQNPLRTYLLLVANPPDEALKGQWGKLLRHAKADLARKEIEVGEVLASATNALTIASNLVVCVTNQSAFDKAEAAFKKRFITKESLRGQLQSLSSKVKDLAASYNNLTNRDFAETLKQSQLPLLTNVYCARTNQSPLVYSVASGGPGSSAASRSLSLTNADKKLSTGEGIEFEIAWRNAQGRSGNELDIKGWSLPGKSRIPLPFMISLLQEAKPSRPEVQLVVWPYGQVLTNGAIADQNGHIQIANWHGVTEALARLPQDRFETELHVNYMGGECSAIFPFTNGTFSFAELSEMLGKNAADVERLKKWHAAVTSLSLLQEQLTDASNQDYTDYKTMQAAKVWEDLGRMCQILVKGRDWRNTRSYQFDQDPVGVAQYVLDDLRSGGKPLDAPLLQSVNSVLQTHIRALDEMVRQENGSSLTVQQLKGKMQGLLSRCQFDATRLQGAIWLRLKSNDKLPERQELIRLRFAVRDDMKLGSP